MNSLQGKIIITTGAAESSVSLAAELAIKGATVFSMPMIDIQTAKITETIKNTVSEISTYNWLLFTSKYGVSKFFEITTLLKIDIPKHIQFACVGKKTALTLEQQGYSANFICTKNNGNDLAIEFSEFCKNQPVSVLFPTGNLTQNMIELSVNNTIHIHKIVIYNTNPPDTINAVCAEKIIKNQYDYLIFTSPSTITNFVNMFRSKIDIRDIRAISIGPSTTKTIQKYGITNVTESSEYNFEGIITTLSNL